MNYKEYPDMQSMMLAQPSSVNAALCRRVRCEGRDNTSWFGVRDITDVERLARDGWPEGLAELRRELDVLSVPRLRNVRRRKARADFGDAVDMQAVYSGNLARAWETTRREAGTQAKDQHVTVVANLSVACKVRAQDVFWRGAAAMRIVDALLESGRNVQVFAYDYVRGDLMRKPYDESAYAFKVKDYGQHIAPERLAFALCLPAVLRWYIFKVQCSNEQRVQKGLGKPIHNRLPEPLKKKLDGQRVVFIDSCFNKQAAQAAINNHLEELAK